MAAKQNCAFVQFTKRADAARAAEKSFGKLLINNKRFLLLLFERN